MKIDVQWSPIEDNVFLTSGPELTLHQINPDTVVKEHKANKRSTRTTDPGIITLDSKSLQQVKHVAWYPKADHPNIFAVGQANGRISMVGLNNKADDLIGKEFNVRVGQRNSQYLSWNPLETNLLAQGFDKNRNDPCILIWDVTREFGAEVSERSRHSFSEGPIVKPFIEMGFGEGSVSLCWIPHQPFNLITGNTNKHLRIYDRRETSKFKQEAHNRCVFGICLDPLDAHRMASYSENQVAVWDLRSFDKPTSVITEHKNVTKLCWCPTNAGVLSVLTKDCPYVRLHDIKQSLFGSDDIEQVSIERKIQPFKSSMSSFAWHPNRKNCMMTVMPNGQLKNMVFYERLPVKWSSVFPMHINKREVNCLDKQEDIVLQIKKRLERNYGQDPDNIEMTMRAVESEPELHGLWKWIHKVRNVFPKLEGQHKRIQTPADLGIMSVLYSTKGDATLKSEAVPVEWKTSQGGNYARRTFYKCQQRNLAVHICKWLPDDSVEGLKGFRERSHGVEREAAMSVFNLEIDTALRILSDAGMADSSDGDKTSLQAVAMALSGYTEERDTLWQRTCGYLRTQMDNPYLRAIFTFLACEEDKYEEVLADTAMSVADRVLFALLYLSDAKLKVYLTKLVEELIEKGHLDGILLTGLTRRGIDLLQRYVDITLDVQTAAIAASFSSSLPVIKDPQVNEWIEWYRDLMDQWKLWHERAVFDNVRHRLVPENKVPAQILVTCNFCNKSISSMSSTLSKPNRFFSTISSAMSRGPQHRQKVSCCPSCSKALPRCAICLTHMGTLSGAVAESSSKQKLCPFEQWFSWCQTCRHGGHAGHMTEWFGEHAECPVTGCPCQCMALDSVSQTSRSDRLAVDIEDLSGNTIT